jgi:hypothetical protein
MMTAAAKTTSRLAHVTKSRLRVPLRYVIYGQESVGKSSLAAHAPAPIWLDIEDGSGRLDVARYPFRDGPGGHVPQSFAEVLSAVDDLTTGEHSYQTLVVDTVDRLESLIWRHMIERDQPTSKVKLTSVESYGYGKGFQMAVDEWRGLLVRLDRLRIARNMAIVLIGHAQIRTFKSPDSDDYDRYSLRLNDKAAGLLREWTDVLGFAAFEDGARARGDERAKGWSTGRRLLKLQRTAAYDAKSRVPLPPEVELDPENPWAPFAKAVDEGLDLDPQQLIKGIDAEVARIGDQALAARVKGLVEAAVGAKDAGALARYLSNLQKRPTHSKEETANV